MPIVATTLRRNALANFGGRSWNAAMSLLFVPIYIRLMGAESYGLVGFFVSLQMVLSLLEMGLGTTATKEVARLSGSGAEGEIGNLVRTLEVLYVALAAAAGILVFAGSEALAVRWFNPDSLTREEIRHAIVAMGAVIAVRMPFSLYSGALMGLQRHVLLNGIIVVMVSLKHLGAAFLMFFLSPTAMVFFTWNLVVETVQTVVCGYLFWKIATIPGYRAGFDFERIRSIWRFATGVGIIGVTNVMLSQADKLFVSKMFSLETFGYYSAIWTVAGALFFLTYPITTALFPRFAQQFGKEAREELYALYRKSNGILAAVMLPLGVAFWVFSKEIVSAWLPMATDPKLLADVFRVIVVAVMLNSLFNLPLNLQLASGSTGLILSTNVVWLLLVPVFMWLLAARWGLPGVPWGWLAYNLFCLTVIAHATHRKLFAAAPYDHIRDIGIPLLTACVVIGIYAFLVPVPAAWMGKFAVLGFGVVLGQAGGMMTIADFRNKVLRYVAGRDT